jgi:hypothetical protein
MNRSVAFLVWALLALAVIFATHLLAGLAVPIHVIASPPAWAGVTSQAVLAVALTAAAARAPWRGFRLGLALSGMAFAIDAINLAEGAAFLTQVGLEPLRLLALFGLAYALAVPLWVLVFRGAPVPRATVRPPARGAWGELWRFAACSCLYTVLYFTAGSFAYPFVREFYATQTIPPFAQLVALQLLLRGPVQVGICILLVRMIRLERLPTALAAAAVFALMTAIAPLATPSPFFPDAVRLVHLCEVGISNLGFALVVGWTWAPRRTGAARAAPEAAESPA